MKRLITQNHLCFMKHLRRTFKHACSSVSWKISYFSILIPKENRYRFGIPDCCFAFCFASINIDITIFAMRFNNSLTIRFVPVSHRVIYWTWNSFARENCPLTENPEGFFSFSFFLSFFFFHSFPSPFFDRVSHAKTGKRTRNIFQCERKSEQYRVKRIGK